MLTSIKIHKETVTKMKEVKITKLETYDEIILRLIKFKNDTEEHRRKIRDGELSNTE